MTIDLQQGDCLELMKDIPDESVDLILCDLPYGTTQNKWDSVIPLDKLWGEYKRISIGAVVLTAAQPFTSLTVVSNIEQFRYQWVWEKPNGSNQMLAKAQPLRVHEDVLVFCRYSAHNLATKRCPYNPQGLSLCKKETKQGTKITENLGSNRTRLSSYIQEFSNYPRSILKFGYDTNKFHPTQKPVALMEYMIRTYTNEGMTVLDNCMGSGTTGVACVNTNRNFIGIEKDENYFAIAKERIGKAVSEKERDWLEEL